MDNRSCGSSYQYRYEESTCSYFRKYYFRLDEKTIPAGCRDRTRIVDILLLRPAADYKISHVLGRPLTVAVQHVPWLDQFSRSDSDYENGNTLVVRFRAQAKLFACSPRQNSKTDGMTIGFTILSGCRESNPDRAVPNREHCHYATPRHLLREWRGKPRNARSYVSIKSTTFFIFLLMDKTLLS